MNTNKLKINAQKTSIIVRRKELKGNILLNGTEIERVEIIK